MRYDFRRKIRPKFLLDLRHFVLSFAIAEHGLNQSRHVLDHSKEVFQRNPRQSVSLPTDRIPADQTRAREPDDVICQIQEKTRDVARLLKRLPTERLILLCYVEEVRFLQHLHKL